MAVDDSAGRWEGVYRTKDASLLSWYEPQPTATLGLFAEAGIGPDAAVVDVGGGASTLVDVLLGKGFRDVTVLDISPAALAVGRARTAHLSGAHWIATDLLQWSPGRQYDVWHDRAVFHFLIGQRDRDRYRQVLSAALRPGGHVVIGTFSPRGPTSCSGLPTARYDADQLAAELGEEFQVVTARVIPHTTPDGRLQEFTWIAARRL